MVAKEKIFKYWTSAIKIFRIVHENFVLNEIAKMINVGEYTCKSTYASPWKKSEWLNGNQEKWIRKDLLLKCYLSKMVINVLSVLKTKVLFAALYKVVLNCFGDSSTDVVVFNSYDKVSHVMAPLSWSVWNILKIFMGWIQETSNTSGTCF